MGRPFHSSGKAGCNGGIYVESRARLEERAYPGGSGGGEGGGGGMAAEVKAGAAMGGWLVADMADQITWRPPDDQ